MNKLKLLALAAAVLMILNVALFAFRKIDYVVFWIVIAIGALFAYKIMPRIK